VSWEHLSKTPTEAGVPREEEGEGGIPEIFSCFDFVDDLTGESLRPERVNMSSRAFFFDAQNNMSDDLKHFTNFVKRHGIVLNYVYLGCDCLPKSSLLPFQRNLYLRHFSSSTRARSQVIQRELHFYHLSIPRW